jgi:parallel beta-helix repeat protein
MKTARRSMALAPTLVVVLTGAMTAAPATAAPKPLACGAVVTESTTLSADVGPCTGPGLVVAADNVTLDLHGHRVVGRLDPLPGQAANTANASGITFRRTRGSAVKGGEVLRFAIGVRIDRGSGNRVTDLDVHDNIGRDNGDGIALFGSDANRIDGNRVVHNGQWSGISLLNDGPAGSSDNVVAHNVIRDNNIPMFDEHGAAIDKRDIGVAVEGPGATHNRIVDNTVAKSGTDGIQVFPACSSGYDVSTGCPKTIPNDYNVISGNTVVGNGFGAPLEGALGDGIALLAMGPPVVAMPNHNTVVDNTVTGNQRNGISLGGGNGQELSVAAWTTGGENYGCFISPDPDDPFVDTPNLCGVNDNTVTGNTSSGNGVDGIYVGPRSDDNRILRNTADGNGKDGIGIGLAVRYGPGQVPVYDANGRLETVAGSGGRNNLLADNTGKGNKRWDGADENPACDHNQWMRNRFRTVNRPCVR